MLATRFCRKNSTFAFLYESRYRHFFAKKDMNNGHTTSEAGDMVVALLMNQQRRVSEK